MKAKKTPVTGHGRVSRLSIAEANRAIARVRSGEGQTGVAYDYGLSVSALEKILQGKTKRFRDGLREAA
jgi:hypothetical protein